MSDIVSSDNLVNALNSVRDDYHEHLKSIPQYEAFLLIESSTHRVFETLHGIVNSPAPAMAAEVISSLEIAKTKFKEHLTSVPEYRALLAIEKLINDVSIDLGVAQPAPAPVILTTVEHEIPPEPAAIQPEPDLADSDPADFDLADFDLADSKSEQAVLQPAAAEIASIEQLVAPQAEPDLAASASEHTLMELEAPVVASAPQIVATQPEPDVAVPAFEHTLALAAEIASNHLMSATQLDPDLAASASEHATTRVRLSEIAFAGPVITAQNEYLSEPVPAKERAATGEPAWNTAAVAVEELYDFDEPPAAPREDGSERAA
jgi:hypothetical protein